MNDNAGVIIRGYTPQDRAQVRRIGCETTFLGNPRRYFFEDDEILADVITAYYTDYEPWSCFVAVKEGKVIAYIIGSRDTRRLDKLFNRRILPRLIIKAFKRGLLLKRNTRVFLRHLLVSYLKGELYTPDFSRDYPGTLHINIDKDFRGLDIGTALVEKYLGYLRENKVRGVCFCTISEGAKGFFIKSGFEVLFESRRSHMRYLLGKDEPAYIIGKKL